MALPRHYRIEVLGKLPSGVVRDLPDMVIDVGDGTTSLSGPLADSAALYGLIARLEGLGLALLSVQPQTHGSRPPQGDTTC